jgi:hypothetical protein
MIAEHLSIRKDDQWRFRRTQGVVPLPTQFSSYLQGRHRQALRTNVTHAHRAGLTVDACTIDIWSPGKDDTRGPHIKPGPVERWTVLNPHGEIVADSILSVDQDVALLHGLVSQVTYARWLLHNAIVERLCDHRQVLLVNSDDAYLTGPGVQYFQRLLGYEIACLQVAGRPRPRSMSAPSAWTAAAAHEKGASPAGIDPRTAVAAVTGPSVLRDP